MKVVVNGEVRDCAEGTTLATLLSALQAAPERVATLVNDAVVSHADREEAVLKDGDRVEILVFAGGG